MSRAYMLDAKGIVEMTHEHGQIVTRRIPRAGGDVTRELYGALPDAVQFLQAWRRRLENEGTPESIDLAEECSRVAGDIIIVGSKLGNRM